MTVFRPRYPFIPVCAIILAAAAGCSVEKNTASTRFYHGLTSHYNIYFNGNESFKAGIEKIERSYRDDYSELLQVFEFSDPSIVSAASGDMERAIMKASKLISLKSITAKPEVKQGNIPNEKDEEFLSRKEYNEWVDDSYLLMGKARLYKRDLDLATSTLSYTVNLTADPLLKTEATIWLARSLGESGNLGEAQRVLSELEITPQSKSRLKELYYTTQADLYLKQKKYSEAADALKKAIDEIREKRNRYRYTYLLAQIAERSGDAAGATALYRKIVKMNPPYEVEFNARINLAGVFDTGSGNPEDLEKELNRMLKDEKNEEFQDQIYYALAQLSVRSGNMAEAIEYYKKSASVSTVNPNQKGKSYLALATYYYDKPDYLNSGRYYDSTVMFLQQKFPDYDQIVAKSRSLNLLVNQIVTVEREDSLQRVARMPETERDALIAGIIENVKKGETAERGTNDNADRYNLGQYYENEMRFRGNIAQEGKWYFYNQTALTFGRTEFRRRWGDRRLEDNWRRLNKARLSSGLATTEQGEGGEAVKDTSSALLDTRKPEFYLRNLPLNDSLLALSDNRIANALLEAGRIYSDQFADQSKSVASFESVAQRFPGTEFEAEALYNIYRTYRAANDVKSEIYRQKLISQFPDNEFTRIISDPDYFRKKNEEIKASENLYIEAYNAYTEERFVDAISLCSEGLTKYPKDLLAPKFQLLKSFATARTADERKFKEELTLVTKLWPTTPEAERAAALIAFLNQEIPQLKKEEDTQVAREIYTEEPGSPHQFIVVIMNPTVNLNQVNFDIISYNIDTYTDRNFRTQANVIDNRYAMFTVTGFARVEDAMEYYNAFDAKKIIRNPSGATVMTFIIGKTNLETLNTDKNPERYLIFFTEKYLTPLNK